MKLPQREGEYQSLQSFPLHNKDIAKKRASERWNDFISRQILQLKESLLRAHTQAKRDREGRQRDRPTGLVPSCRCWLYSDSTKLISEQRSGAQDKSFLLHSCYILNFLQRTWNIPLTVAHYFVAARTSRDSQFSIQPMKHLREREWSGPSGEGEVDPYTMATANSRLLLLPHAASLQLLIGPIFSSVGCTVAGTVSF